MSLRLKLCMIGLMMVLPMVGIGCGGPNLTPSPTPEPVPSAASRIAHVFSLDGNVDIYVMDADDSNQRNLSNNPAADFNPAWSP